MNHSRATPVQRFQAIPRRGSGLAAAVILLLSPPVPAQSNPPGEPPPTAPSPAPAANSPPPVTASPPPAASPAGGAQADPVFNSEGVDQLTLEMLQRRPAPPPVLPVVPRVRIVIPPDIGQATNPFIGLNAAGLGSARAALLPEGAFLVRRRGSIVKSQSGEWVFLSHPDAQGAAERAIVILPSPGLAQIEDDSARLGPRTVCYLTGQVFQYRWQNYILPTAVNITPADEVAPAPAAVPPSPPTPDEPAGQTGEAQPEPQPEAGPATAESVIRNLEQRRSRPRSISRPVAPAPAPTADTAAPPEPGEARAPIAPQAGLLTERRARITRLADGRLAVAFDRGFGPGPESTMPLLECSALQRLEAQALGRGDAAVFTLTGRAVPYRERTYFLLAGFHTAAVSDVNSLQ